MKLKLSQIVHLLDAVSVSKQAKLDAIKQHETQLRAKLSELGQAACTAPMSTAVIAGADVQYLAWSAKARRELNLELARTLAAKESARLDAARAVGRREVAKTLVMKK